MELLNSDCLTVLNLIDENSIDSVVTDPPAGISFMGKSWDDDKGGRDPWIKWLTEVMRECNRVLKPGGHALVWAIPRTSHWTMTAIENAGFEIRDVVTHLFGSGFPKSHDVSKGIDKAAGAEREIVGVYQSPEGTSGFSDGSGSGFGIGGLNPITAPSTPEAIKWQGFGTALKPAAEFWILARKPLSEKTVVSNVLKWGTGALNIDASRIEFKSEKDLKSATFGSQPKITSKNAGVSGGSFQGYAQGVNATNVEANPQGRFPANLVFSHTEHCTDTQCDIECAIKMLDEQSGVTVSGGNTNQKGGFNKLYVGGDSNHKNKVTTILDRGSGGASRFFYCTKASKSDKGTSNTHPTVKSTKLMSYLIKLITPPEGTVLDPFMGSGSTGVAAKACGFKFIGVEKEKEYFEIAEKRIYGAR